MEEKCHEGREHDRTEHRLPISSVHFHRICDNRGVTWRTVIRPFQSDNHAWCARAEFHDEVLSPFGQYGPYDGKIEERGCLRCAVLGESESEEENEKEREREKEHNTASKESDVPASDYFYLFF